MNLRRIFYKIMLCLVIAGGVVLLALISLPELTGPAQANQPAEATPLSQASSFSSTADIGILLACPTAPATITVTPVNPSVGQNTTFRGDVYAPGTGGSVNITWSFGDGFTGTGAVAQHAYAAQNTYPVVMTATGQGCVSPAVVTSTTITVGFGPGGTTLYLPLIFKNYVSIILPTGSEHRERITLYESRPDRGN